MTQELRIISQTVVLLDDGTSHPILQVEVNGRQAFIYGRGNPCHFLDLWPEFSGGDAATRFLGATHREAVEFLELRGSTTDGEEWNQMQREARNRWLNQSPIELDRVEGNGKHRPTGRYDLIRG